MKNLKKVATDAEIVAKEYAVIYYSEESGKVGVKNAEEADYLGDFHYILTIPSDGEYPTVDSDGDYKADVISKMWIDGEEITPTTSTTLTKGEHVVDVIFTQEHMEDNRSYKICYNIYVTWASFAKRMTTVPHRSYYECNNLTTIEIPEGVTSIGDDAFTSCGFTSVTIPDLVTSIGDDAFSYSPMLTNITIPSSVTSIGYGAFVICSCLTSVTYNGTIAQWNSITKGDIWKKEVPSTCKVHCTDGDINIADA